MNRARNPDGTFAPRGDAAPVERRADNTVQNTLTFGGVPGIDKGASLTLADRELWMPQEIGLVVRQIGLASRLCVMVAEDATRAGWMVCEGADRDIASDADEQLAAREKANEALWTARVYGCALLVMVPKGGTAAMLKPRKATDQIVALQVYDGPEVFPQSWEVDPTSPNYRNPLTWLVTPSTIASAAAFTVHASWCVYFFGARMPRRVRYTTPGLRWLDMSILESYRSALMRNQRFYSAVITLAEAMDTAIFKMPGLVQILSGPPEQAMAAIQRLKTLAQQSGNVGLGVIDGNEEYERHPLTATGIRDMDAVLRRELSEVEGIPQVKMSGDTPSGLNSDDESGKKEYSAFIAGYQHSHLTDQLRQLYGAVLGKPPGSLRIEYNPIDPITLGELAEIEGKLAARDVALAGAGLIDASEVRARLAQDETTARYTLAAPESLGLLTEPNAYPGSESFQSAQNIPSGTNTGSQSMDGAPAQVQSPVQIPTPKPETGE